MDAMQSVGGFDGAAGRGARQSKVDRVYLALKQAIISGELAPLTLIDKNEWSARFEISRLSITSAINRLGFEGLVVIEPQRGSYVSKIRLADVKQWMMMRRLLEVEVATLCAAELSVRAMDQMSQNLGYQRAALDSGDLRGFHELDTRFHRQMTNGLGLERVGEALDPCACTSIGCVERCSPRPGGWRKLTLSTERSSKRSLREGRSAPPGA